MNSAELTAMADRLEAHNRWRRDAYDIGGPPIDPVQIGLDLDAAIRIIRLSVLRDDPRHINRGGCPVWTVRDARDDECPACQAMAAIEAGDHE